MPLKKPIIDASSAILLYKCGLFPLVAETYSLQIAKTVREEITRSSHPDATALKEIQGYDTFQVIDVSQPFDYPVELSTLGAGERDAIACYLQNKGDFIITDDGKAAKYCSKEKIPFINALLVPKVLYFAGVISKSGKYDRMACLIRIGRYSDFVLKFAQNCPVSDLHRFFPK